MSTRTTTILPVTPLNKTTDGDGFFMARFPVFVMRIAFYAFLGLAVVACDSDLETDPGTPDVIEPDPDPEEMQPTAAVAAAENDAMVLQLGSGTINLVEGGGTVSVPVTVTRKAGQNSSISLTVSDQVGANDPALATDLSDATLAVGESSSTLVLRLAIGPLPIQAETRSMLITATDGSEPALSVTLQVQVIPTTRPDVYLLVGQSNMVGFSEDDSKQAGPGEPDATNARIRQLNVTGNDQENFSSASDFTNDASLYNTGSPLSAALDPLHDGFDVTINGKAGGRIGPGLSFAKRALLDTTADIILVPAAWSDTGFCKRDTNRFPTIGWLATPSANPAFSGTLLHDRAIARANIALDQTDGILRGILWHQGEADSDDDPCAESYAANLTELAASLRTNIDQDARGATARGPNSDVPFIVATMSRGGNQSPFSERKLLVDSAHRNIASLVPTANFVNNDDLVPAAFPCGEGSCIHFGAAAYREMGIRYYEQLIALFR